LNKFTAVWVASCLATGLGLPAAAEWAHWRGPAQDGSSPETGLVASWSSGGENLIWSNDFTCRSTPVVFDGRVCVIGRVGQGIDKQERVACFDAGTGAKRWEHRFNVYNSTVAFPRVGWASLAGDPETGNVYAQGVGGQLIAYDRDGKVRWLRQLTEEFGRATGYGGRTQTPLVDGDHVVTSFVNVGWGAEAPPRHRYYAFDKRSGELVWVATPGKMIYDFNTQSGCTTAEVGGRHLLVCGNADGWIYALDGATGERVWGFELSRGGIQADPLVHGDRVFASHGEENIDGTTMGRLVCIDATGKGEVTKTHEVWRRDGLAAGFPSPAYHAGRLYVVDNSANLFALDAAGGAEFWSHKLGTVGKGSPVLADGKLYATEVNGRVHILEPGGAAAKVLDEETLELPDGRHAEIYGSPAIAYGRAYLATEGGLYCLGPKDRPFAAVRDPLPSRAAAAGQGEAALLRIVPAEVLLRPGEPARFAARRFDALGRALPAAAGEWSVEGLAGAIDAEGRFTPDPARRFQAGVVAFQSGGLSAKARVRVIADLPWSEDFESTEVGKAPAHWIGTGRDFVVHDLAGRKVLRKVVREQGLNRATTFFGTPAMADYTFEAEVLGAAEGRRRPDIGIIASGYTLDLMGAAQKLQLRDWAAELRIKQEAPLTFEPDRWYKLKLSVDIQGGRAIVRGKAWPADQAEPEAWAVTAEDPHPITAGSPGLIGYSPVDLYYDNLKLTRNE